MDIKYELLANTLSTVVREKVEKAFDGLEEWSNATAMVLLVEIGRLLDNEALSDSDIIKKIKEIYTKYNIDYKIHHIK